MQSLAVTGASPFSSTCAICWTQNPYYRFGPLRQRIDRAAETRLLAQVHTVTVPTQSFRNQLVERYPRLDVRLVRTGVIATEPHAGLAAAQDVLRIGHFGQLEEWIRRDPLPVVRSAAELIEAGVLSPASVHFDFYGAVGRGLQRSFRDEDLSDLVSLHGTVTPSEARAALQSTDVGLLLMWRGDTQSFPMKVTEYMAAGKPVMVWDAAEGAEVRRVLSEYDSVFMCDTTAEVESAIAKLATAKRQGVQLVEDPVSRARPFLQPRMASQFLDIASELVWERGCGE